MRLLSRLLELRHPPARRRMALIARCDRAERAVVRRVSKALRDAAGAAV